MLFNRSRRFFLTSTRRTTIVSHRVIVKQILIMSRRTFCRRCLQHLSNLCSSVPAIVYRNLCYRFSKGRGRRPIVKFACLNWDLASFCLLRVRLNVSNGLGGINTTRSRGRERVRRHVMWLVFLRHSVFFLLFLGLCFPGFFQERKRCRV